MNQPGPVQPPLYVPTTPHARLKRKLEDVIRDFELVENEGVENIQVMRDEKLAFLGVSIRLMRGRTI
jgi:hypothetical protein